MTGNSGEIEIAAKLVIKKAAALIGHLAKPDEAQHYVYELARLQLACLTGPDALHDAAFYKTSEVYNFYITSLMLEIESAVKETELGGRRG